MFVSEEVEESPLLKRSSLEVESDAETKTRRPAFHYAIVLTVLVGITFLLVARNLPADSDMLSSNYEPEGATIDTISLHLSIVEDRKNGVTRLIDNAPILCRHSILTGVVKCPTEASVELATAEYSLDVGGNGWNYMSIKAIDMLELKIKDSKAFDHGTVINTKKHPESRSSEDPHHAPSELRFGDYLDVLKKAGDLSPVRQQYIRTMHGVGVLEGYKSCKEIGDWYANFYDGLFNGGEVNRATMEFLEANHVWMNAQAALYWEVDDYWMATKGMLAQLEGLLIGAQKGCPGTPIDDVGDDATNINDYKGIFMPSMEHGVAMQHLLLMNSNGDLFQIMQKYPANLVNGTGDGRHGDNSVDTDGVVDDYVDDYSIAKSHNITTHFDDDDEAYAYGTDGLATIPIPELGSKDTIEDVADGSAPSGTESESESESRRLGEHPARIHARKLLAAGAVRPTVTGAPTPMRGDLTDAEIRALPNLGSDHCSALIKILPDLSDVVFGHDTWDSYQTAYPRVFKHVSYNRMKNSLPIANDMMNIYFSASPGLLASIDDFYVIHGNVANLAVTETSLDVYNDALIDLISPTTMLCWARTIVSNRLATSGNTWVDTFSRYSSGTYSNQWMVLDFNRFEPYSQPRHGFLTVLEEIPGLVHHEDLTEILVGKSYWASYNNPYFKEVSVLSGVTAKCKVDNTYCHYSTPRAKIFRAQHSKVRSVADLQALMEYNQYVSDPFSKSDSCKAIACRKDLEPDFARRSPFGSIDSKISSANLARRNPPSTASLRSSGKQFTRPSSEKPVVLVKLGPTTLATPAFCWSNIGPSTPDSTAVAPVSVPDGYNSTKIELGNNRRRRALQMIARFEGKDARSLAADARADAANSTTAADPVDPAPTDSVAGGSDSVHSRSPTAQPSFLTAPRMYVHKGHPDCFDFDWEILPPQK